MGGQEPYRKCVGFFSLLDRQTQRKDKELRLGPTLAKRTLNENRNKSKALVPKRTAQKTASDWVVHLRVSAPGYPYSTIVGQRLDSFRPNPQPIHKFTDLVAAKKIAGVPSLELGVRELGCGRRSVLRLIAFARARVRPYTVPVHAP